MKNSRLLLILIGASLLPLLLGSACDNHYPTSAYQYNNMPTPTPGPAAAVTVSGVFSGSYQYSPGTITITRGQSVMWDTSNSSHPLNIDNGSGMCLVSGVTSFPYTYTFMMAGTYHFHCGVHSTCGNGSCPNPSTCSGMIGTITVN